ncbi:hypothetical protein BKA56DRAFT_323026 [Ilyonectria sp. MPI-CAGE-AT-0026]|nr:hypothetical protein BKA56DRAFT_323026 [Ilyonectria sp. MPI-CAGE-AT-0026]
MDSCPWLGISTVLSRACPRALLIVFACVQVFSLSGVSGPHTPAAYQKVVLSILPRLTLMRRFDQAPILLELSWQSPCSLCKLLRYNRLDSPLRTFDLSLFLAHHRKLLGIVIT